ncbi:hypothetical protein ASPCAL03078 [Aspergillus calidoustus]|uniref:Uncharacterized protein n=1 Tax=Aspergillus calidoustus TaxID=454130 RepID=A0A0U5CNV1_ASPCI|nr:hypothetical protein ASPCAL03078 [Aspergillus calidoustus]
MPSSTQPHPTQREIEPHPTPPESYTPHPENSLPLPPHRASILQKIQSLYRGSASESDMAVYAEKSIYDDPFSYCDTRYKIAGQWYGIPKLFAKSETLATEVVQSDDDEVVFKQRQRWTLRGLGEGLGTRTVDSLVSLRLEDVGDGEGEKVVYHKDMWSRRDYDHEGFGAVVKKLNGDKLTHITKPPESI